MNSIYEFKRSLLSSSPWLDAFLDTPDECIIRRLTSESREREYEPLLVEPLLQGVSTILDRAIAQRREAYELDILATKAAADYKLFIDLLPVDQKLEINALQEERLHRERSGFSDAAAAFSKVGADDRLAPGLSSSHKTLSAAADASTIQAVERRDLLSQRWQLLAEFQDLYNLRHTSPNNAHNYKQRMLRAIALLEDDVADAYSRCQAICIGLKQVFNLDHPLPPKDAPQVLDELVLWTRHAIRKVELEAQSESTFDVVIPLAQPWRTDADPIISKRSLYSTIESDSELKNIDFKIDRVFGSQRNLRLRAVGLSFGADPEKGGEKPNYQVLDRYAYWRLRATIHLPGQPKLAGATGNRLRPPIVLGDVSVFGRSIPVAWQGGLACHNVNPNGDWRIVLNRNSVWATEEQADIEGGFWSRIIRDLKLHLRVIVRPDIDQGSVFWSKS